MNEVFLPPYIINDESPVLPQSQTENWGFSYLKIKELHNKGITGKNIKVAVIDTGVDHMHDDLKGRVRVFNTSGEDYRSTHGHGTGVAGIIGANNNDTGIIGIAPDCDIFAIKAMSESGGGNLNSIIDAVILAKKLKVDIINMSLGTPNSNWELERAITSAVQNDIIVVCAAGNSGKENSVMYPAKYNNVFAVGAINKSGNASAFTSRGWEVDIAAPGEKILTTWKDNSYVKVSGTSFSAPVVSGVMALLLQAGIKPTHDMLKETAIDIEEEGEDTKTGYGVIDPITIYEKYKEDKTVVSNGMEQLVKAYNIIGEYIKNNS